jgi:hypothetical protein
MGALKICCEHPEQNPAAIRGTQSKGARLGGLQPILDDTNYTTRRVPSQWPAHMHMTESRAICQTKGRSGKGGTTRRRNTPAAFSVRGASERRCERACRGEAMRSSAVSRLGRSRCPPQRGRGVREKVVAERTNSSRARSQDDRRWSMVDSQWSFINEFALVNAITSSTVAKANPVTVSAQP